MIVGRCRGAGDSIKIVPLTLAGYASISLSLEGEGFVLESMVQDNLLISLNF